MYAETKRNEVRLLLAAGVLQERIAELTGVSVRTISRIAREGSDPAATSAAGVPKRARPGRPSGVARYRDAVAEMLRAEPKLKSVDVVRRLRERGYTGGKSAVYELVKLLRARVGRPAPRSESVPGEFSQHDFGRVSVEWTGGGRADAKLFATRLRFSRYVVITCVTDQRVETLVRALAAHFLRIGGLPLVAVFDRPRSIVAKSDPKTGEVLAWNPTFAEVTARLGVAVEASWLYRPRPKRSVENLMGWVRGAFFRARQFRDADDLQNQLQAWQDEVNERRPGRATGRIPGELLRGEELRRLRPVKLAPEQIDLRYPVWVDPTGMVTHETNRYSMPADVLGHSATLHLYGDRVVIEAGPHRAEHPRLSGSNETSILEAHRHGLPAARDGKHEAVHPDSEQLPELGRDAKRVLTDVERVGARP